MSISAGETMNMPRDAIAGLRDLEVQGRDYVPPMQGDERLAHLALMQALKGMTDSLERIADRQDRHDEKLGEQTEVLHRMDIRLSLVESNSLTSRVESLEQKVENDRREHSEKIAALTTAHHARIDALETDRDRRLGERSTVGQVLSGNTLAWLAAIGSLLLWIIKHPG